MDEMEKKENPFEPKGFEGTVYVILHDVLVILCAITVVFVFAARLVGVSGSSMYPTLVGTNDNAGTTGDYLVLQSNVLCSGYERGDVVVACVPSFENGKPIVKRVIATEGEEISFRSGDDGYLHVWVDGKELTEEYIHVKMTEAYSGVDGYSAVVPDGCYFLMGDNRNNSSDSRNPRIGMVDERYIVGKALLVLIPGQDAQQGGVRTWSRFGAIDHG